VADIGKILIFFGGLLLVVGVLFVLLGRTNLPIGRLPGDILYRGKNTTFYFPLTTSIIISVVLSIVLYVISRFRR
jgi:heme/copper-type cytochrome/quinol oxidase subunit 2